MRRLTAAGLAAPAALLVTLFLVLPMALLARYSLNRFVPGQFMTEALTAENYARALTDPYYRGVLGTTLLMASGVTLACLLLGMPLALRLARTGPRWKPALLLLLVLPLFVGNAVRAAGWMVVFGQKGALNAALAGLALGPQTLMYTPAAVFVGILSVNLPFAVLTLASVLEGLDRGVDEAALSLGATPWTGFRLVTLPRALPGVLAAATLSFVLAMNAYATPVLLGGPRFQMMAPVVATEVLQASNWPFGATISFVLMATTLAVTAAATLAFRGRG